MFPGFFSPRRYEEEKKIKDLIKRISLGYVLPATLGGLGGLGLTAYDKEAFPISYTVPLGALTGGVGGLTYDLLKNNKESSLRLFAYLAKKI